MGKDNQGQQTEMVKKQVIALIREGKLKEGDQLPSQVALRAKLSVGSKTIQRALRTLADEGIVELRKNRGVFLRRADARGYRCRKIGLVSMRQPDFVYGNMLLQALQLELHGRGADCVTFLRAAVPTGGRDSMSLFSGLEIAIRHSELDGIVSTAPLDEKSMEACSRAGIPMIYYGNLKCDNRIQVETSLEDAFHRLKAAGSLRHAVIFSSINQCSASRELLNKDVRVFFQNIDDDIPVSQRYREAEIMRIAEEFLAIPPSRRPDGIYIPDDFLTVAFGIALLSRHCPLPRIVTWRTRQIPLCMPFPLLGWFEDDLAEDARRIVDVLFQLIHQEVVRFPQILERLYVDSADVEAAASPSPSV